MSSGAKRRPRRARRDGRHRRARRVRPGVRDALPRRRRAPRRGRRPCSRPHARLRAAPGRGAPHRPEPRRRAQPRPRPGARRRRRPAPAGPRPRRAAARPTRLARPCPSRIGDATRRRHPRAARRRGARRARRRPARARRRRPLAGPHRSPCAPSCRATARSSSCRASGRSRTAPGDRRRARSSTRAAPARRRCPPPARSTVEAIIEEAQPPGEPMRVASPRPPGAPRRREARVADLRRRGRDRAGACGARSPSSRASPPAPVRGRVTGHHGLAPSSSGATRRAAPQVRAHAGDGGAFELEVPTTVVEWYAAIDPGRSSGARRLRARARRATSCSTCRPAAICT